MIMDKLISLSIIMAALAFAVGIMLYPSMPEMMATHWNAHGAVDGYMPRFWGVFLLPMITAGMVLLISFLPGLDPMKKNIAKFSSYYYGFVFAITAFMLYMYAISLAWNLGYAFDFVITMVPAFAALFYLAGVMIGKSKRNWFIGIRTPWTLSSDRVWDKTHALGAKLFKSAALIGLFGLIFSEYAFLFMILPILAAAFITMAYSYFEYKRYEKRKR